MAKTYLTTAIDYANAAPHMGHAYEKVAADAIARFRRLRGDDVFFLTGTDEHGSKIQRVAENAGVSPQAFVDGTVGSFQAAWARLGISHDRFIRTTEEAHKRAVQGIFAQLLAQGDIARARYEGLYCRGCEEFKNERDLVDGKCPEHQVAPERTSEENYVFQLSRYKRAIREWIELPTGTEGLRYPVEPETRRREILNLLEGFPDVSVSRQRSAVSWGIPVPGDDQQVIYVWIDALSNYLTGIGYPSEDFRRWWPADLHLVGKDITKFHAIIWPAILLALGLDLPKLVYGHGWVQIDSQKLSKSTGNVIDPVGLADKYGADAVRYYLLREITFGRDGDFTYEAFENRVNADLANNFGNALNRTLNILAKNFEGVVPGPFPGKGDPFFDRLSYADEPERTFVAYLDEVALPQVLLAMDELRIHDAIAAIWGVLDHVNKYIDTTAPWALAKDGNRDALARVLYNVLETLRHVAILACPFTPELAQKMWDQLGQGGEIAARRWGDLAWGGLREGTRTQAPTPIYPRIGQELAAGKKK